MNKTIFFSLSPLLLLLPLVTNAQIRSGNAGGFGELSSGFIGLINQYLIPLFIAFAVLAFIWGVIKYFILGSDDEEKRKEGRSLMLYAIIGFVAIVALWSIVGFVTGAFGFDDSATIGSDELPQGPGGD